MIAKIYSSALKGIGAVIIEVEVASTPGLKAFNIVGLGDTAIKESKERVGAAIKNIGLSPPTQQAKRVLVNLAPADLKKQGSLYDLPIALGVLQSTNQIQFNPHGKLVLGELALDGSLKPVKGALSFALMARDMGLTQIILPKQNAKEAGLAGILNASKEFHVIGVNNLSQVIHFLEGRIKIESEKTNIEELSNSLQKFEVDFDWIKGQIHAKRGLEIAATGGHNLFLQGPPGSGKTILAKSVVSILPKLIPQEVLELTKIYSSVGLLSEKHFSLNRPFRAPHHSSSLPTLIGGGANIRPGEITLSHRGVLFLDEFPEFRRDALEALRQPIESGQITVQRAQGSAVFPAKFFLIASANPCPCGYYNDAEQECTCTPSQVASYQRKLSGPLMDRFDIFCWVGAVKYDELVSSTESVASETKQNIENSREIQRERFRDADILTNAEMRLPEIKKYCQVDSDSGDILKKYVDSGKLSARGYHRVLKVSRTISDLNGREKINLYDVTEALSYRLRTANN